MLRNIHVIAGGALGLLALAPAMAADAPAYGPAPAWVQPQTLSAEPVAKSGAGVQAVLYDMQVNLAPTTSETYTDNVLLIQTPQGLARAGNIAVSWQPETDLLTIHKLNILRSGKEIDVLATGQTFSVLRRENGLEYAALSGTLTAVIQPEGLQVGDRIEFAYTLRRTDPLLGGVPEQVIGVTAGAVIEQVHLRARWPADYKMTWQASFLDGVKESRVGSFTEITTTRNNDEPLTQPAGAPARFAALRLVQMSGHKSWDEISRLLFPLFDSASRLSSDSALRAELGRIKAATTDQKGRAEAVLRLVQDQIRYVYLGMNDARIVPADIQTTWARRYGDCKAKTALLLALLRDLGITAEPVMVSSTAGDALPTRLPMIGMFDHVLVRATIDGKTYWLDGTRSGDRLLDDLPVPDFGWGLPLRASGTGLLKIETVSPASPFSTTTIVVDASGDPRKSVSFSAETLLRAEGAIAAQQSISALTDKQRDTALRAYWTRQSYWKDNWDEVKIQAVNAEFDDTRGQLRLTMKGEGVMNWQGDQHLLGALSIGDVVDFKREAGPNSDAPYLVPFPAYESFSQRIKLPRAGAGFHVVGDNVDRTIAGTEYKRSAKIANGEFIAESSRRSIKVEFAASEAPAAQKALRELWDDSLYVKLPDEEESEESTGKPLESSEAYVKRGTTMAARDMFETAIADFTNAIKLDEANAQAWTLRGRLYLQLERRAEAGTDLRKALELDPAKVDALNGLGAVAQEEGRTQEAIDLFGRALQLREDVWTRNRRADVYLKANDVPHAAQDLIVLARAEPALAVDHFESRAKRLNFEQRFDDISALAKAALDAKVGPAKGVVVAARLTLITGTRAEVQDMLTDAIAKAPSADLYAERGTTERDVKAAAADLERALKLDPKHAYALEAYVALRISNKQYPEALQLLDRLEAVVPPTFYTRKVRAEALVESGDIQGARSLFATMAAESKGPEMANSLCRLQLGYPATDLINDALRECDAAVAAKPGETKFQSSRGLVLFQLKRYEEAIQVFTATIAAAAAGSQAMAEAYYGRGLAQLRLGRTSEGNADLATARRNWPTVELILAGLGVKR